jgi:UDPglucose 6-dehydrogenase
MKIGWLGLGKLGLPCALSLSRVGHEVFGTDLNREVKNYISNQKIPYEEKGVEETFREGFKVQWIDTVSELVDRVEVLFLAVQTPHSPEFEGCTPLGTTKSDFDYSYLVSATLEVVKSAKKDLVLVIVSTTLPGTIQREILPLIRQNKFIRVVYSPAFIAMGTTMDDFSNPEMVIMGSHDVFAMETLSDIHKSLHDSPIIQLDIIECEMLKMAYNTFIGLKIVFANAIGELCEKVGGNADNIVQALGFATQRIISDKYLKFGMGDGGGCHPRDQLALSWLADRTDLSFDIFGWLMIAREKQTLWLVDEVMKTHKLTGLPVYVCGREYKANTNLTVGSPSRLFMNLMPLTSNWQDEEPSNVGIYFIGVNHDIYKTWKFPNGSWVIDPWGIILDQSGVTVKRIGRL